MPQAEQYVLVTEDGDERTSHVTDRRIRQAVRKIEDNAIVVLEKCRPVIISAETSVFAMSYDKESLFAVHARFAGEFIRMVLHDCPSDDAIGMMCAFFHRQELPDMYEWEYQERIVPTDEKDEAKLVVGCREFRVFGLSDVLVALQNIRSGKSRWMQLHYSAHSAWDCGCMEASRDEDAAEFACKVDWYRGIGASAVGYRTVTSDFGQLQQWFSDRVVLGKYPEPDERWTEYNVEDYFQGLIDKILKEDEREIQ